MLQKIRDKGELTGVEVLHYFIDTCMDADGDGTLTESEVVNFFSIVTKNPDATVDDLHGGWCGIGECYSHLRVSHMHHRSVCSACAASLV